MRRILFGVFVFASICSFAQSPKFLVGVDVSGIWNSYILSKQEVGISIYQGKINWAGGIHSQYSLNKKIALDIQLNFVRKNFGSGVDFSHLGTSSEFPVQNYTVKQNYLEIPIALNYFFSTEKPVNFFCSFGFTNSFFLSAKYSTVLLFQSQSSEVHERYNPYLLSTKFGGGFMFPLGKNLFGSAECNSNVYLMNVNHDQVHNNPFQLALGFSVLKKFGAKS